MKCEYCELRRVGPFVISKACAMLSGKIINKQTGEPLKICMHHMASPDPCMNNGNGEDAAPFPSAVIVWRSPESTGREFATWHI